MFRPLPVVSCHKIYRWAPQRRAGFTLVEILVVIAIIGILAAVLFPVFRNAREAGRRTACQSNMKQLGLAFQQYLKDSGDVYPFGGNFQGWGVPAGSTASSGHWVSGIKDQPLADLATPGVEGWKSPNVAKTDVGGIAPYTRNAEIYICPSSEFGEDKHLSYSMNCALGGIGAQRVKAPSSIILLVDENEALNDGWFWATDTNGLGTSTDTATSSHGGPNFLFADGHAKSFPPDSFPVDTSVEGKKNKTSLTGDVRFHDVSFGSLKGNALTGFFNGTSRDMTKDSCAETLPVTP